MLKAYDKNKKIKISYKDIIDKKEKYYCPECLNNLIFVNARFKIKHFRHKVASDCSFEPETQRHLEMKLFFQKRFGLSDDDYALLLDDQGGVCAICGKPLVGHCLNKKYRYYQCSSARPYENSEKVCQARYVRADDLENNVWSRTQEIIRDPGIVLAEIQRQLSEVSDGVSNDSIDAEIQELEKYISRYEQRRSNLLEALELGEFDRDEVLDRLSKVKRLRFEAEAQLKDLLKIRDNLFNLANAKIKLGQLYERVIENLQTCTPELKILIFDALDIKVFASTDKVEIQGVIPLESPTTAQTSA